MKNSTEVFHKISYLQYPLMAVVLYYIMTPYFNGFKIDLDAYNKALVFMGISVTFSTLQDTTKTQNKLSLRIFQNPSYSRIFLILIACLILFFLGAGITGMLGSEDKKLNEVAFGMIIFGLGLTGLLKSAAEMAQNHRLKDR